LNSSYSTEQHYELDKKCVSPCNQLGEGLNRFYSGLTFCVVLRCLPGQFS
jgi:hypothetical protein